MAMKTLEDKGMNENLECVACHVVGFEDKGGFASVEASPHLANVQCENCHGPRKEHVKNPAKKASKTTAARDTCVSCHKPPHSTEFIYQDYWQKVVHGFN